ncbi:hypothetical protein D5085_06050 [Ectothiorhodospiraceae bacterium BW-2]|nr:hypothetical protein D5085_06050 [Ectothiorhodospiraceae bacterium BW-2]
MMTKYGVMAAGAALCGSLMVAGCGSDAPREISFKSDVMPILQKNCVECHTPPAGSGYQESGLALSSYDELMKGTKFGKIVEPGSPVSSTLNRLIEGKADPSITMPHGKEPMTEQEIVTLSQWVAQGAKNN